MTTMLLPASEKPATEPQCGSSHTCTHGPAPPRPRALTYECTGALLCSGEWEHTQARIVRVEKTARRSRGCGRGGRGGGW